MKKNKKAFTLIELLVTIAIISTLSSIAIVSFSGQTAKARDARRKSDLANLQQALEMYYDDNGSYPTCDNTIEPTGKLGGNGTRGMMNVLYNKLLLGHYINSIPTDPKWNGIEPTTGEKNYTTYTYYPVDPNFNLACATTMQGYVLFAKLESDRSGATVLPLGNQKTYADAWGYNYRIGN